MAYELAADTHYGLGVVTDKIWGWLCEVCTVNVRFMIRGQQINVEYIVYLPLRW